MNYNAMIIAAMARRDAVSTSEHFTINRCNYIIFRASLRGGVVPVKTSAEMAKLWA